MTTSPLTRVHSLLDKGVSDNAAGRAGRAARSLRAVVRLTEDGGPAHGLGESVDRARVRALMGLATAEFERVGLEAALTWMDRAAAAAEALGDAELDTLCHSQTAMLYGRSGDLSSALEELTVAAGRLGTLSPRDQAVLLLNYGNVLMISGDLRRAMDRYGRCAEVALAHGLRREAFMSRFNQGEAAYRLGDLPRALDLLGEAEAGDADVSMAVVGLVRGRVLLEAGLLGEALDALVTAAAQATGQRQVLGELEIEVARALALLGRFTEGRAWARRARSRFRRRSAPVWAARAELVLGQLDLLAGRSPRSILRTAEQLAAAVDEADRSSRAEHLLIAAEAALAVGDRAAAAAHLELADQQRQFLPLRGQLVAGRVAAELAVAEGREGAARRILCRASKDLVRDQAAAVSTDLRAAIALHAYPLALLHLQLARPHGVRAVFECSERWRATSNRVQPVRPPDDPELADLLTRIRALREDLRDAPIGVARDAMLHQEYLLRQQARSRAWGWQGRGVPDRGVSYRHTREVLEAQDADLVSLVADRGTLLAIAVVGGRARLVELGSDERIGELARRARADLDAAGRHDLGQFTASVWGSLRAAMSELDEAVLRPLGIGGRRVVMVPHRNLYALPWALAPSLAGVPLVISSSATDWTARVRMASTLAGRPAVTRALAGPALELADQEVGEVAAHWPGGGAHLAADSTVELLREAMAGADLVHVAAHGTHHQQSPMFASVQLADGQAYLYDLQHRGVQARHVVLSACEVGRATIRVGDEALGLSAGLLALGAQCVVAGVSRVPDEVSAQTMTAYHAALASGLPSDVALARVIEQGPALAAAFQCAGAPWASPNKMFVSLYA